MIDNEVSRFKLISQFLQKATERWWFRVGFPILLYIATSSTEALRRNIGLGEAILKLPLFIWRGLHFNFIIPVWVYILSVSLPFIFYYILVRITSAKTNVSRKEKEKEEKKIEKDNKPDWWNYREDIFKGKKFR